MRNVGTSYITVVLLLLLLFIAQAHVIYNQNILWRGLGGALKIYDIFSFGNIRENMTCFMRVI